MITGHYVNIIYCHDKKSQTNNVSWNDSWLSDRRRFLSHMPSHYESRFSGKANFYTKHYVTLWFHSLKMWVQVPYPSVPVWLYYCIDSSKILSYFLSPFWSLCSISPSQKYVLYQVPHKLIVVDVWHTCNLSGNNLFWSHIWSDYFHSLHFVSTILIWSPQLGSLKPHTTPYLLGCIP